VITADQPFLDANILFSAALAPNARMRRLWALDPAPATLMTSDQTIMEARRNLPLLTHPALLQLVEQLTMVLTPPRDLWIPLPTIALPDDDMAILQAAIAGGATHLLTGNRRHFGPYFGIQIDGLVILPPAAYPPPDARVASPDLRLG